jgi:hypothetical protein
LGGQEDTELEEMPRHRRPAPKLNEIESPSAERSAAYSPAREISELEGGNGRMPASASRNPREESDRKVTHAPVHEVYTVAAGQTPTSKRSASSGKSTRRAKNTRDDVVTF